MISIQFLYLLQLGFQDLTVQPMLSLILESAQLTLPKSHPSIIHEQSLFLPSEFILLPKQSSFFTTTNLPQSVSIMFHFVLTHFSSNLKFTILYIHLFMLKTEPRASHTLNTLPSPVPGQFITTTLKHGFVVHRVLSYQTKQRVFFSTEYLFCMTGCVSL